MKYSNPPTREKLFFLALKLIFERPDENLDLSISLANIFRSYLENILKSGKPLTDNHADKTHVSQLFYLLQLISLRENFLITKETEDPLKPVKPKTLSEEKKIKLAGLLLFVYRLHLYKMHRSSSISSPSKSEECFKEDDKFNAVFDKQWPELARKEDYSDQLKSFKPFAYLRHDELFMAGVKVPGKSRGSLPGYMETFLRDLLEDIERTVPGASEVFAGLSELSPEVNKTYTHSLTRDDNSSFKENNGMRSHLGEQKPARTGLHYHQLKVIHAWWKYLLGEHFSRLKATKLKPFTDFTLKWLQEEVDGLFYKHGGSILEAICLDYAFPPMLYTGPPGSDLSSIKSLTQVPLLDLYKSERTVIWSKPFLGKTTLLKMISTQSQDNDQLALYFSALEWKESQQSDLLRFLAQVISRNADSITNPEQFLYTRLQRLNQRGRLLLLVDDVDKLPPEKGTRLMRLLRQLGRSIIAVDQHGTLPRSTLDKNYDPRQDLWLFGMDGKDQNAWNNLTRISKSLGVWDEYEQIRMFTHQQGIPRNFWVRVAANRPFNLVANWGILYAYCDMIDCCEAFARAGMLDPLWFLRSPADWESDILPLLAVTALCSELPGFPSDLKASVGPLELEVDDVLERISRPDLDTLLEARFLHLLADGRKLRFYDYLLLENLRNILDAALAVLRRVRVDFPPQLKYQDTRHEGRFIDDMEHFLAVRYHGFFPNDYLTPRFMIDR